jgi:phosphotransferase system  glucose/maltose/N-acetylglucosamine-specific IIC component
MKTSAIIMLVMAWSVITFFTFKFFLKVLKTPTKEE